MAGRRSHGAAGQAGGGAAELELRHRPAELLQRLIRFDTTNPPGAEAECIGWIEDIVRAAGADVRVLGRDEGRPNLVARVPGRGDAPPLLLQGHVDVVPAGGQDWTHPPFGGEEHDGFLWGRGALDMKGGVAMMLAALLRAAVDGPEPPGDVVLCALSDEEAGGGAGARWLVDEHPELFTGVRFALGEFGGFSMDMVGRRFYPIMVAEKRLCRMRATVRGPGGHGSLRMPGGTLGRLGDFLRRLDRRRLPVHVTPVVRDMMDAIAAELPLPLSRLVRGLTAPPLTDRMLDLLGERGAPFDPMLHNTINPTIVRAGEKLNVIPGVATVDLDGRVLPGFGARDMLREVGELAGEHVELEVLHADEDEPRRDLALFDVLAGSLREGDASGRPIPYLLPAVSDGRHFARLGIQTYGFLPMQLPADMRFMSLIHAADERIPVAAVGFGADAISRVLERFGAVPG
jgi:acetylornithine deacetylase/succinyl-diaminopimelate desuccinylase-like protein